MESSTLICGSELIKGFFQLFQGPGAASSLVYLIKSLEIRANPRTKFMSPKSSEHVVCIERSQWSSVYSICRMSTELTLVPEVHMRHLASFNCCQAKVGDVCQHCYSKKLIPNGALYLGITKNTLGSLSNISFESSDRSLMKSAFVIWASANATAKDAS